MNYVLEKADLPSFLGSLQKSMQVIAPSRNSTGATSFQPYKGQEIFLAERTRFSPKRFFTPWQEKMFSFKKEGKSCKIEHIFDKTKRAIFGIRPCDTHALHVLDELFIRYYGEDQYYSARRKNAVLMALQCSTACKTGFCTSIGTSQAIGHDLLLAERGQDFIVQPETERGKKLLDQGFFKKTSDAMPSQEIKCSNELNTGNIEDNLCKNFSHPIWRQEALRCLSCTSCTAVCPTCYCYYNDDRFSFGTNNSIRSRVLDSCQLPRFTTVAGPHTFRPSREGRLRQFVLHKLSYYKKNHGMQLCVGCGRCIEECPVKISLVQIANTIQGEGK